MRLTVAAPAALASLLFAVACGGKTSSDPNGVGPWQFGKSKPLNHIPRWITLWDWAYAITCHKAQGSEWPTVIVVEPPENDLWSTNRWAYTAATRAQQRLVYLTDRVS